MLGHPTRQELMAYAEALVDRNGAVSARIAAHVKACPACTAEVKAMHRTLRVVVAAPELEPSSNLTASILLAAREERRRPKHGLPPALKAFGKAVGFAAGLLLVASVVFNAALQSPGDALQPGKAPAEVTIAQTPAPEESAEDMQRMTAQVESLAAALTAPSTGPLSYRELEHRRSVAAWGADLEAAKAALERNPGCARADALIDSSIRRQARTLRTLYAERSL